MGRPAGFHWSPEARAKISAGVQRAWDKGTLAGRRRNYKPPEQYRNMYEDLRTKVGATEAQRLLKDHIAKRGKSEED